MNRILESRSSDSITIFVRIPRSSFSRTWRNVRTLGWSLGNKSMGSVLMFLKSLVVAGIEKNAGKQYNHEDEWPISKMKCGERAHSESRMNFPWYFEVSMFI